MTMNTDTETLAAASTFRKLRALCRAMRKWQWCFDFDEAVQHGSIRTGWRNTICPLSAIEGKHSVFAEKIGRDHGFSECMLRKIVHAADNNEGCDRRLRRILLRAAGLKETRP